MEILKVNLIIDYLSKFYADSSKMLNEELVGILDAMAEFMEVVSNSPGNNDITFNRISENDSRNVSLATDPQVIISNILGKALVNGVDELFLEGYNSFQSTVLKSKTIPDAQKLKILSADQFIAKYLDKLTFSHYNLGVEYFILRIDLYRKLILNSENSLPELRIENPNLDEIFFNNYIKFRGRLFYYLISQNELDECKEFVIKELYTSNEKIVTNGFFSLIQMNDLYVFMSKEDIYSLYIEHKEHISSKSFREIEVLLSTYPVILPVLFYQSYGDNEILQFQFPQDENDNAVSSLIGLAPENATLNGKKFKTDDSLISKTIVQFVIPHSINTDQIYSDSENITFYFTKLSKYIEHPFYRLIDKIRVSGITIGHLLEMEEDKDNYTQVTAEINESFHPDFRFEQNLDETKIIENLFREEEAIQGGRYSPVKTRILKGLINAFKNNEHQGILDISKVNFNLFSSFKVDLVANNRVVVSTTNFFTSSKVFAKFTRIYYDKLSALHIHSKDALEAVSNYNITNNKNFNNLIVFIFENFIINTIRGKSGYKYFWKDETCYLNPKKEPEVQPYLLNVIEPLCQLKGINVSREPNSAEGNIDMFFSYTTVQGKLLKICVEVKNAHHANIVEGVKTQLMTYLISQNTRSGIYLVLWYKNKNNIGFQEPKGYLTQDELVEKISDYLPWDYDIKPILIDCTKPLSPSKIRLKDL